MKSVLKKVGVVLAVLVAGVGIAAATQPDTVKVSRSVAIAAPAEAVFPYLANFEKFNSWNPYYRLDPGQTVTYSGPASGAGHSFAWDSEKVGAGRMTIKDVRPNEAVLVEVEFIRPFASRQDAAFAIAPADKGVTVSWTMEGPNSAFGKVMGLFFSMDELVGKDFQAGLNTLKSNVESSTRTAQAR